MTKKSHPQSMVNQKGSVFQDRSGGLATLLQHPKEQGDFARLTWKEGWSTPPPPGAVKLRDGALVHTAFPNWPRAFGERRGASNAELKPLGWLNGLSPVEKCKNIFIMRTLEVNLTAFDYVNGVKIISETHTNEFSDCQTYSHTVWKLGSSRERYVKARQWLITC